MYETIIVEKKNHVAILTLNRPEKLNATNPQLKREVSQALTELEADEDVRVVILTGAGSAFSSGADLNDNTYGLNMPPAAEPIDLAVGRSLTIEEQTKLLNFAKPVIAAVNGYALGDGAQHALMCDIIIASEKAIFGFIGARLAAVCDIAAWALPGVVGRNNACELLFTCDQISADEGYRIGLVNKVVPHEQLMPAALEMAEKIAKNGPLAIKYTKRVMRQSLLSAEINRYLEEAVRVCRASEDIMEAFQAAAEEREPVFKGK